jgi:hypothetical protein
MSTPHLRAAFMPSGQRGTSWARRLLRGGHSRGAPTKLVNADADEHGMVVGELRVQSMPSCGKRKSGSVASDLRAPSCVISWTQPADAEEIVARTVGRRETKDDILAKRLA